MLKQVTTSKKKNACKPYVEVQGGTPEKLDIILKAVIVVTIQPRPLNDTYYGANFASLQWVQRLRTQVTSQLGVPGHGAI